MFHDQDLVDRLSGLQAQKFDQEVFRATRLNLDPLAFSVQGGRWAPHAQLSVLYTSLAREGALAEISYYWSQLSPLPTKPVALHRLRVKIANVLRLSKEDLVALGVDILRFGERNYTRTQEIGAVMSFLGRDGMIVPSARWDCENLVVFNDNQTNENNLEVLESENIEWREWAIENNFITL